MKSNINLVNNIIFHLKNIINFSKNNNIYLSIIIFNLKHLGQLNYPHQFYYNFL